MTSATKRKESVSTVVTYLICHSAFAVYSRPLQTSTYLYMFVDSYFAIDLLIYDKKTERFTVLAIFIVALTVVAGMYVCVQL